MRHRKAHSMDPATWPLIGDVEDLKRTNIYTLLDETQKVRYVGKTIQPLSERLRVHFNEAIRDTKNHRCNWIRSMLAKGVKPTMGLLAIVEGNGCVEEIAYIAAFRNSGVRLVNQTDGGEGTLGYRHSKEAREKISERSKRQIPWNKGRKHSPEHRIKQSKALMGHLISPETRKKISKSNKGKFVSAATITRLIESHRGQIPWNKGKEYPHGDRGQG